MGLFLTRENCCICHKNKGKKPIIDGYVCWDCINLSIPYLEIKNFYKDNRKSEIIDAIEKGAENAEKIARFSEAAHVANPNTKEYIEFGDYIKADDSHQWWYTLGGSPNGIVFNYSDIIDYEIIENGSVISETKAKNGSGLGRAIVGGAIMGPAGAIVGAATKKKKQVTTEKEILTSLIVRVTLDNANFPTVDIKMSIPYTVPMNSILHTGIRKDAEKVVALLRKISGNRPQTQNEPQQPKSTADELLKLKELLDSGLLTQEEFNQLKSDILK